MAYFVTDEDGAQHKVRGPRPRYITPAERAVVKAAERWEAERCAESADALRAAVGRLLREREKGR
jgi:hypothetical protein